MATITARSAGLVPPAAAAAVRLAILHDPHASMEALAERRLRQARQRLVTGGHDPAAVDAYLAEQRRQHEALLAIKRVTVDPRPRQIRGPRLPMPPAPAE